VSPVARPLPLHVGERAYLNEMRALSTDREGNEILVGLSFEESDSISRMAGRVFCHLNNGARPCATAAIVISPWPTGMSTPASWS
jgi:hypothetical protein